jgi:hypothetical protein
VHLVGFTIEAKFHINRTEIGVTNFNFGAKTHKEISKTEIWKPFSKVYSRAAATSNTATGFHITAIYTFDLGTTNLPTYSWFQLA